MLKWFDWIFLARPIVLIPSWAFLLAGYLRSCEIAGDPSPPIAPLLPSFLLWTLLLSGAYVVNQIFDRETDKENGKLFLIAEGHVSTRSAWIEALVLGAASFAGAAIFLPAALPWLAAAALLGFLYSAGPARLKGRPVADLLSNAVGYGGVAFLFGFSVGGSSPSAEWPRAIPYVLLVGAVFLHTALVDQEGDRKAGLRTSAILLGERGTSVTAVLLLVAACGVGAYLREPYASLAALGAFPFFLWGVVSPGLKGSTLGYQWGSLLFVLLLIIQEPWFGLFIVLLVFFTRMYYRFRFHLVYPKLDF